MTTMVLIRHEETEWNKTSPYHGHADLPCHKTAKKQVAKLAVLLLLPPLEVICSDLSRPKKQP